jgi:hypothetical protein
LLPSIEYSLKSTQSSMELTKGRKCVAVQWETTEVCSCFLSVYPD